MFIKLLRDHLPWVAPTAALVFFATTYLGKDSDAERIAQAPATVAYDVNAKAVSADAPVQASIAEPISASEDVGVVTRLSMVTDSSLQALQPEQPAQQAPAVVAVVKPLVQEIAEPAKPAVQTASLNDSANSAAFFANAQANLMAKETCVGDLRALSERARVYFPAGGLTLDESGIAQARLIASLVQECDGVEIIVEGHSDPSGNPAVNLRLSKKRAEQVIQRLGASGLDTSVFIAQGIGSERPSTVVGPESSAYYDRRVEFVVIETGAVAKNNRFNSTSDTWAASSCVTELRSAISQHTDDLRSGENPATGRLRAKAIMAMLVGQGIDSGQIIMAAPSRAMDADGTSGSRLDFDVIVD